MVLFCLTVHVVYSVQLMELIHIYSVHVLQLVNTATSPISSTDGRTSDACNQTGRQHCQWLL